jgi:hypothetical protein
MSNFFLYGDSQNPTIIYGKYDRARLPTEFTELFTEGDAQNYLNYQARAHEFWYSSDVRFIPHGSSAVFVTDVQGNITHEGNLLTKKNITVNGSSTFLGIATFDKPATFKDEVTIEKTLFAREDIRITRNLYVQGRIFSSQIDALEGAGDITAELEEIKARIKTLEGATEATTTEETAAETE